MIKVGDGIVVVQEDGSLAIEPATEADVLAKQNEESQYRSKQGIFSWTAIIKKTMKRNAL